MKTKNLGKSKCKSFPTFFSSLPGSRTILGPLFIAIPEKHLEPWPLAQNLGSNRIQTAADLAGESGFGGKIWVVEARFSVVS